MRKFILSALCAMSVAIFITILIGCSDVDIFLPEDNSNVIVEDVPSDSTIALIDLDNGKIGLIIDTRRIFKKGYVPKEARITFAGYGNFDSVLDIDELTNLAVIEIENDSLSEEEKVAFDNGVVAQIVIANEQNVLVSYQDNNLSLNTSNIPLSLETELEFIYKPIKLNPEIPYIMVFEETEGVVTARDDQDDEINPQLGGISIDFKMEQYGFNNVGGITHYQQFYFKPVVDGNNQVIDNKFKIRYSIDPNSDLSGWIGLSNECINQPDCLYWESIDVDEDNAVIVEFEQFQDGKVLMRVDGFNDEYYYLKVTDFDNYFSIQFLPEADFGGDLKRLNLLADNIDWVVEDKGTFFQQPIIPAIQLDFAYSANLRNCSAATLIEEVGRFEEQSNEVSYGTSESFQIFSSYTQTLGFSVGFGITGKVGGDPYGGSVETTLNYEANAEFELTQSETQINEQTWSTTTIETVEVSRIRTLELPPYTWVEVFDMIKSVDNVKIPWVKKFRISGTYNSTSNSQPLTGAELSTQMRSNLYGGVITQENEFFIDVTLRGNSVIESFFEAATGVSDVLPGCEN